MTISTSTTARPFAINDQVRLTAALAEGGKYDGVIFSIERLPKKRNEVNVVLAPITGGASVRVNPVYIELVEDASGVPAAAPASLPTATAVAGSVVKSIGSQVWREPAGSLWVVLKEGTRPDCVKIAKLGGKDNNYYANVPLKLLAAVSMAELPAALAEQAAL